MQKIMNIQKWPDTIDSIILIRYSRKTVILFMNTIIYSRIQHSIAVTVFGNISKRCKVKIIKLFNGKYFKYFLELQQFKWKNKHAVNMIQNCFYSHAHQSFPPCTNLVPDLTMQGRCKKVFKDKNQLLCLFDLRENLKDKGKRT